MVYTVDILNQGFDSLKPWFVRFISWFVRKRQASISEKAYIFWKRAYIISERAYLNWKRVNISGIILTLFQFILHIILFIRTLFSNEPYYYLLDLILVG